MSRVIRGSSGDADAPRDEQPSAANRSAAGHGSPPSAPASIGGTSPAGGSAKVVAHEIVDARDEARRLVEAAQQKAVAVLRQADKGAQEVTTRAAAEGRADGLAQAAATLIAAQQRRAQILEEAESALVTLATEAAERVIRAELALAPERVRDIARDLVARVRRARTLTVRVHPDDLELVRSILPRHAEIRPDTGLQRADVVLETESGELDARIAVQLAALRRAIEGG